MSRPACQAGWLTACTYETFMFSTPSTTFLPLGKFHTDPLEVEPLGFGPSQPCDAFARTLSPSPRDIQRVAEKGLLGGNKWAEK